jgi:hypothetical protein
VTRTSTARPAAPPTPRSVASATPAPPPLSRLRHRRRVLLPSLSRALHHLRHLRQAPTFPRDHHRSSATARCPNPRVRAAASPSFGVESFFARRLHSKVVTHILDLRIRFCRNFVIIILIDSCFGKSVLVRCFGKSRDLGHLISSPFSRRSEVAITFRFTSYLILSISRVLYLLDHICCL